ncbi:MAG: 30S ribosomal protein S18 [Ktedonobacterales bacterium]
MQQRRDFGGPSNGAGANTFNQTRPAFGAPGGAPSGQFDRPDRPERSDRFERSDRGERGERGDRPDRPPRFGGRGRDFRSRRKVCAFCVDHIRDIDYKDVGRLRRYISDRGKIEPRRKTGACAKHQRRLSVALKNARHMAMLPYTAAHIRGV